MPPLAKRNDHERLGPLASEAVLKMTTETAHSVDTVGEELKTKIHELTLSIQKMNEDTSRALNELDSMMKTTMLSIESTSQTIRENGDRRAKMIAEVAESLRRVDQQCQTMRGEFDDGNQP